MRNKPLCGNCTFWEEIGDGHIGKCKVLDITTKWRDTCREYIKYNNIKEVKK